MTNEMAKWYGETALGASQTQYAWVTSVNGTGNRTVVSTNGQGDESMVVFDSPSQCPYYDQFPRAGGSWNVTGGTLIYVVPQESDNQVEKITVDGQSATKFWVWNSNTLVNSTYPFTLPKWETSVIFIPGNASMVDLSMDYGDIEVHPGQMDSGQVATSIVEADNSPVINHLTSWLSGRAQIRVVVANNESNVDLTFNNQTVKGSLSIHTGTVGQYNSVDGSVSLVKGSNAIVLAPVRIPMNASANNFTWDQIPSGTLGSLRQAVNSTVIVDLNNSNRDSAISFINSSACPYNWGGEVPKTVVVNQSTVLYLQATDQPLTINGIFSNGEILTDLQFYSETRAMGTNTSSFRYPLTIPAGSKAIIVIPGNVSTIQLGIAEDMHVNIWDVAFANEVENGTAMHSVQTSRPDPENILVKLKDTDTLLLFGEGYDGGWYVNDSKAEHVVINGFLNGWVVDRTSEINLIFRPQSGFSELLALSGIFWGIGVTIVVAPTARDKVKVLFRRDRWRFRKN